VYEAFNFTGRAVPALGAFECAKDRTVTVGSFSKAYALTGLRVGYLHTPAPLLPQLLKLQQQTITNLPGFVQEGAIAALQHCQDFPVKMAEHYAKLTEVVREELGDLDAGPLEGAFYAFVDISRTGMGSLEFSEKLYAEYHVACVPGAAFGEAGEGRVRVSYAAEEAVLREGLRRLSAAIKAWSKTPALG
jgi:aspartate/methionine/tyrosine aminotransferase